MTKTKDGGPAFPVPNDADVNQKQGMSLRAWLAGMALSGLTQGLLMPNDLKQARAHGVAQKAVAIADALIAELEKEP